MCDDCPAGKFSSTPGASACTACAAGYYNPTPGATACLACAAGYFSAVEGSASCQACAANSYSNTVASTSCIACGSGFYSPPASTACTMCNVTFTAMPTAESCAGAMDGQIAISGVMGGTGPFMYSIDNGANYAATATFMGLSAGNYPVRVLDDFGCESDAVLVMVGANACPLTFSGTILWEHDDASGVQDATVQLSGAGTGSGLTNNDGDYQISVPLINGDYTLKPVKSTNKINGVTVGDALAIQQHLTGFMPNPITDPYKLVAGDVDKSNYLSTYDALLIKQVILNNALAHNVFNTDWRFVVASHSLGLPPWGFPEQIDLIAVNGDQSGLDFTGIKLGDVVSGYADPASFGGTPSFRWRVADQLLEQTGPLAVTVQAAAFDDLAALQCAFRFDPHQLAFDSIERLQSLPLGAGDFGLFDKDAGEIRMAWTNASQDFDLEAGDAVFRLHFDVLQPGSLLSDVLQLDDSILSGFAYTRTLTENPVELDFVNVTATGTPLAPVGLHLFQNRPNPFAGATTVSFLLPGACAAQLRVLDINGRELLHLHKNFPAGLNDEVIQLSGATGVLYYELITPYGKLTRKMTVVGQ